jgi:small subunit ribosomal protein S3
LRADIDYGFHEAHTTFGRLGVKVWIYKGEVIGSRAERDAAALAAAKAPRPKSDRPRGPRGSSGPRRDAAPAAATSNKEGGAN